MKNKSHCVISKIANVHALRLQVLYGSHQKSRNQSNFSRAWTSPLKKPSYLRHISIIPTRNFHTEPLRIQCPQDILPADPEALRPPSNIRDIVLKERKKTQGRPFQKCGDLIPKKPLLFFWLKHEK